MQFFLILFMELQENMDRTHTSLKEQIISSFNDTKCLLDPKIYGAGGSTISGTTSLSPT